MAHEGGTKAIVAAFLANLGIAITKFFGFVVTGSSALLAESVHSVADAGNQGLLVLGGRRARRAPTPLHPFGYGRDRYFWAFIVAVVLFLVGGLFALYEGYHKVSDPHDIDSPIVAFVILGVAVVLELASLRVAVREARAVKGDRPWPAYIRRSRSPELPVVLLEDLGALFGLVLALAGVSLAVATGDPVWDGIGTLAIGVLLVLIAAVLAVEMKSLLIGESATPEMLSRIEAELAAGREVRRVIHMRTQHIGPDELLVGAKVEVDPSLSVARLAAAINDAEARVRAAVPIAGIIYLEPDLLAIAEARDGAAPPAPPDPGPAEG
jgi:cation diffusion facilitator family transporter